MNCSVLFSVEFFSIYLVHGFSVMSTLALLFSFMQPWHDLHCKIEGRAAYDILTSFEQRWRKATKWSEMGRKLKRVSNWNDDSLIKIEHISWILSPSELTPVDDPKLWVSKEDDPENWHVQVTSSLSLKCVFCLLLFLSTENLFIYTLYMFFAGFSIHRLWFFERIP